MTRAIPAIRLGWIGLLLACVACSTEPTSAASGSGPTATPGGGQVSTAVETPATEGPEGPEVPASTSGPLSRRSFPSPRALGPGWRYAVDPGDAEEGYLGNGTPALERDPREVVLTAVPLGCARKAPLPTPAHVLEVDYLFRDVSVIALRMRFEDAGTARSFHGARQDSLRACQGRSGGPALGVLVREVRPLGGTALLSDRTPDSDPWSELAVLDGPDVLLVAARARPGRPPFTRDRVEDLATRFGPPGDAPADEEGPTP